MLGHLTWLLPAVFVVVALIYAAGGHFTVSSLFFALALGMALHAMGVRDHVRPLQWFGAAIAAFALVVLFWLAFAT